MNMLALVLAALAAGTAPRQPLASVNHFFAVVDPETAAAIEHSPLLREAANLDVHSTSTPEGRHWTGRYVRGRQTYVEFFGPGDLGSEQAPVGSLGIGFGGDRLGTAPRVVARLHQAGLRLPLVMARRLLEGRSVDWFWAVEMPDAATVPGAPSAGAWLMEYAPSYFDQPGARHEAAEGPGDVVSRERGLDDGYREHLLRDLKTVDFSITAEQYRTAFAPLLAASGFAVVAGRSGVTATSMGVTLRFWFVAPGEIGLNRITFRLNRPVPVRAEQIGNSCLVVGPDKAVWSFRPPPAHCGPRLDAAR
jgi:hypothetical protein